MLCITVLTFSLSLYSQKDKKDISCKKVKCPELHCRNPMKKRMTDCCMRCPGKYNGGKFLERGVVAQWSNGENIRLPPMRPRFDSQTQRHICGLNLLVLYSVLRSFSPGTPVFPCSQKPTFDLI